MTAPFEHATDVREALRAVVADRALGPEPLANAQSAANLLRDLLPDAPRETGLLLAAIAAGSPTMLREHIAQGMAGDMAISLTAAALASRTAFTLGACQWVVTELAIALCLVPGVPAVPAAQIAPHPPTEVRAETSAAAAQEPAIAPARRLTTTLPGSFGPEPVRPRRGSGRRKLALLTATGLALAAAVGVGLHAALPGTAAHHRGALGRHHGGTPTAPVTQCHPPAASPSGTCVHQPVLSPAGVVEAYIAAVNQHKWPRVWALGGKNLGETYRQLIAGYAHTRYVQITSITTNGSAITVTTTATETSGTTQRYRLSYLVSNGTITAGQSTLING